MSDQTTLLLIELDDHLRSLQAQIKQMQEDHAKQIDDLQGALDHVESLAIESPELNLGNYDHDQVCDLNAAMVEICLFLANRSLVVKD